MGPLPLELLLLRLDEVELECFRVVGEVGSTGWSCMGLAGMVVIGPKPPIPGTMGDVGLSSSIVSFTGVSRGDRTVGRSDRVF